MDTFVTKAARLNGPRDIELIERELVCGEDDIIVKNHLMGICGSDKNFYRGYLPPKTAEFRQDPKFPFLLGHESGGTVVAVGSRVADYKVGDKVMAGPHADIKPGNALPFENIPVGTMIHNIELYPGKGGQLVRSAGVMAQLMAKENGYALVRLPSGEMRNIPLNCIATIGVVSNLDHENVNLGKAGRKRHMGVRPGSRGSVMNPCDHPHGGGEGRAPVGHSSPRTPWGKPALGLKTRKHHARSDKFIVKRAKG